MDEDTDDTAAEKLRRYAERGAHVGCDIEAVVVEWRERFTRDRGEPPTELGEYYFRWHTMACRDVLERLDHGGKYH